MFAKFITDHEKTDSFIHIEQFDMDHILEKPLDAFQRDRLKKSVTFPERWLDEAVLGVPKIREVVNDIIDHAEMVEIQLAWNRIIIRDYKTKHFFLFYPLNKKHEFKDPVFIAGYRNLIASIFPVFSRILFHSAGVMSNGKALVFLAPDAGGKTTVVNLSRDMDILSDDFLILQRENNSAWIHSTPLGTMTDGPRMAKLGAIFLLKKSNEFKLTPIPASNAIKFIWNEQLHQWLVLPKPLRISAFEILCACCLGMPVFEMRFPKHHVDWDAVKQVLEK